LFGGNKIMQPKEMRSPMLEQLLGVFNKTKLMLQDSEGPYPTEKAVENSPGAAEQKLDGHGTSY
jgi:hypothetical protein